jgi:hypothetical protein
MGYQPSRKFSGYSPGIVYNPLMPGFSQAWEGSVMKFMSYTFILSLALVVSSVWAATTSLNHYKTLTLLEGDWMLSPADEQEGGATKKGPAEKLVGTENTAISFNSYLVQARRWRPCITAMISRIARKSRRHTIAPSRINRNWCWMRQTRPAMLLPWLAI